MRTAKGAVPTALVTGASGYIGSRLVAQLVRDGYDVVATARDPAKLEAFDFPVSVRTMQLDAGDAESCRRAFALAGAVDVLYYLIHSIGGADFAERDLEAASTVVGAAESSGVGRVVYLGGFVPSGEDLSEHLDSRAEVGDALGRTTVDLVWLRAAIILGAGSTSYELVRHLAERLPIVPMPAWMRSVVSPIAVDDVLCYLVAAADPERVPGGSYDISNGERLSYADLIQQYADAHSLRRWWLPVRGVSPALAAPMIARLTPIPGPLVSDLVESLANTMCSDDQRIRAMVPDPSNGLTTLADAISRADAGRSEGTASGVMASADPLGLCDTDPEWAHS